MQKLGHILESATVVAAGADVRNKCASSHPRGLSVVDSLAPLRRTCERDFTTMTLRHVTCLIVFLLNQNPTVVPTI
jgi:hypothetical protein